MTSNPNDQSDKNFSKSSFIFLRKKVLEAQSESSNELSFTDLLVTINYAVRNRKPISRPLFLYLFVSLCLDCGVYSDTKIITIDQENALT